MNSAEGKNIEIADILIQRVKETAGEMTEVLDEYLANCEPAYYNVLQAKLEDEEYKHAFQLGIGLVNQVISGAMIIADERDFDKLSEAVLRESTRDDEDIRIMKFSYLSGLGQCIGEFLSEELDQAACKKRLARFESALRGNCELSMHGATAESI